MQVHTHRCESNITESCASIACIGTRRGSPARAQAEREGAAAAAARLRGAPAAALLQAAAALPAAADAEDAAQLAGIQRLAALLREISARAAAHAGRPARPPAAAALPGFGLLPAQARPHLRPVVCTFLREMQWPCGVGGVKPARVCGRAVAAGARGRHAAQPCRGNPQEAASLLRLWTCSGLISTSCCRSGAVDLAAGSGQAAASEARDAVPMCNRV